MTEKKKSTDELYADRQWSDNLAFSRKAMDESKKKTGQFEEEPPPKPKNLTGPGPTPQARMSKGGNQLDQYVTDMNKEINRVSDAVGERIEHVGKGFSKSVKRLVKPMGKTVNEVAETTAESFKTMSTGIGKAMLSEFTSVIRNLGDKVSVSKGPVQSAETAELAAAESSGTVEDAAPALNVRTFKTHFGTLLEQKIFFSTIHARPFLTERDIEVYRPGDAQQAFEWMTRGLDEIRNCAPYGQKLPTPKKGPYMNIPMYDVLRQISHDDLEGFLHFVLNRPQPFQQKALKLSEAFATWVHKGAPER